MGWLTTLEWNILMKKPILRTVEIDHHYRRVYIFKGTKCYEFTRELENGRTIKRPYLRARRYWIDRLVMITMALPSGGSITDSRAERIYVWREDTLEDL